MLRSIYRISLAVLLFSMLLSACTAPAAPAPTQEMPQTQAPAAAAEVPAAVTEAPAATTAPAAAEAPAAGAAALPQVDPAAVTGDIIAAGSSTVFPLAEAVAEKFKDEGYTGKITIDSIGSGAGFERFCKTGETDISTASRKIKDTEKEACKAIHREPIEFRIGTDALAVVVSKDNTFLQNVTLAELAKIYSKDATKWSDVNPAWPAENIQRFSPGTDSGTFDYFVESVMTPANGKDAKKGKEAILNAPGIQLSEDDNVLVQGVAGSPNAIGYFGFAYLIENEDKLKAVSVEGIAPSFDTAENGQYKLSRPLFIYSDAQVMQDKPQVAAFINYLLTNVNDLIGKVGYFPASEEALKASAEAWLQAEGGAAPAAPAAAAGGLPQVDPAAVTGDIIAAGSSTVFPLAEAVAEQFKDEGYAGQITIDSIGSGAGFERFCKTGETDIANASRKIKDTEVEACKAINRTPIEFRVGTDAIAIVVSKENTFLQNVTLAELAKIYSKDAARWSDVNPAWPAEDIQRFSPGTDSGTFDYFVEAVMTPAYEKDAKKGKEAILNAPGIQLSEDDNVLVQGVTGSPNAIGYFGFAYLIENEDKLKAVSVEGIAPSFDTAENGQYKLSRPLFIYSDAQVMQDKPQVAAFINYLLTNVNDLIGKVGYFPASEEALKASAEAWLQAAK